MSRSHFPDCRVESLVSLKIIGIYQVPSHFMIRAQFHPKAAEFEDDTIEHNLLESIQSLDLPFTFMSYLV